MPKVLLKQRFVRKPPVPTDKQKIQYFDELEPGFILEVTKSGNGRNWGHGRNGGQVDYAFLPG